MAKYIAYSILGRLGGETFRLRTQLKDESGRDLCGRYAVLDMLLPDGMA